MADLPLLLPDIPVGARAWRYALESYDAIAPVFRQVWFEPAGSHALQITTRLGGELRVTPDDPAAPPPPTGSAAQKGPGAMRLTGPDGAVDVKGSGYTNAELETIALSLRRLAPSDAGWVSAHIGPSMVEVAHGWSHLDTGPRRWVGTERLSLVVAARTADVYANVIADIDPSRVVVSTVHGVLAYALATKRAGVSVVWTDHNIGFRLDVIDATIDEAVAEAGKVHAVDRATYGRMATPGDPPDGCSVEVFNEC